MFEQCETSRSSAVRFSHRTDVGKTWFETVWMPESRGQGFVVSMQIIPHTLSQEAQGLDILCG